MVPLDSNGRHMEAGPMCPRRKPFAYSLNHDELNYYHICLIFFESPTLSPFFLCLCNLSLLSVSLWEIAAQRGAQNPTCHYLLMSPAVRTDLKPKSECLLEGRASVPVRTLQGDPRCVPRGLSLSRRHKYYLEICSPRVPCPLRHEPRSEGSLPVLPHSRCLSCWWNQPATKVKEKTGKSVNVKVIRNFFPLFLQCWGLNSGLGMQELFSDFVGPYLF